MVVPYIHGLGEKIKRTCNKQGIQVHFKGTNTNKQLLMAPKGQEQQTTGQWGYLQVQMSANKLYRGIHRGIREDLWGQIQGTS